MATPRLRSRATATAVEAERAKKRLVDIVGLSANVEAVAHTRDGLGIDSNALLRGALADDVDQARQEVATGKFNSSSIPNDLGKRLGRPLLRPNNLETARSGLDILKNWNLTVPGPVAWVMVFPEDPARGYAAVIGLLQSRH